MELENIYFKISPATERLDTEYRHEDELSQFYRRIRLDVFGRKKGEDTTLPQEYSQLKEYHLGFIDGIFLHMNRMSREMGEDDIWIIFDHLGHIMEGLGDVIFESDQIYTNVVGRNQNIFLIKSLYIHGPYRGQGIGRRVITDLEASLVWIFDYSVGSFIINPVHYAEEMEKEFWTSEVEFFSQNAYKQTIHFFQSLGFRPIREGTDFMYLNTDFEMVDEEAYIDEDSYMDDYSIYE
jgi:GNAT superfamily N-acetyltransferase